MPSQPPLAQLLSGAWKSSYMLFDGDGVGSCTSLDVKGTMSMHPWNTPMTSRLFLEVSQLCPLSSPHQGLHGINQCLKFRVQKFLGTGTLSILPPGLPLSPCQPPGTSSSVGLSVASLIILTYCCWGHWASSLATLWGHRFFSVWHAQSAWTLTCWFLPAGWLSNLCPALLLSSSWGSASRLGRLGPLCLHFLPLLPVPFQPCCPQRRQKQGGGGCNVWEGGSVPSSATTGSHSGSCTPLRELGWVGWVRLSYHMGSCLGEGSLSLLPTHASCALIYC